MAEYVDNATVRLAFPPLRIFPEDPAIEIFCTGLVMDVVTDLSRFRSFRILSDDPVALQGGAERPEEDRHLDYTVRGLAHYHGESVQITLQLHSLRENRLVWGEKFGGPLQELFRIQEEIVEKREEGGVWMMTFESVRAQVRDLKGLHDIARQRYGFGFVIETPTWRANTDWGYRLGYSEEELRSINMEAIRFGREVAEESGIPLGDVIVSGCIGPRGDGYSVDGRMTAEEAEAYHAPQIGAFAQAGADVVTAMTLNYIEEGVGIVRAAKVEGIPVVISFTLETDGRLPGGESLQQAIEQTDRLTDGYASYFMINCAHPEHFQHELEGEGEWKNRIRGIRANASTKSHAELDESETLDVGDHSRLADGYRRLRTLLPEIRVVGGCCGTDHTHIDAVCEHMFAGAADGVG